MPGELPPTRALQAFSRAAHSGSFKLAASELHMSPSALSRQIQALESLLGVALFRRLNPGIELTEDGSHYLEVVDRVLAELETVHAAFATRPRKLRVSALESFASNWLVPNLPGLRRLHPEIEIELEASLRYADFARDPVDVAIRFGVGPWGALYSEPLLELYISPVCSPALRAGPPPLCEPGDLRGQTLVHMAQTPDAWPDWLRSAGLGELETSRVTFDHVGIALSAVESGQGVALLPDILCAGRLAAGTLCRPFSLRHRSRSTYHFVCRPEQRDEPRIRRFRDWMVEHIRSDAAIASALAK